MQVRDLRPGRDGSPPEVRTASSMVRKAREGVMEFLLINHPLDCPICDQGGECDLQDQAMAYGVDFSRFREAKRAVEDLDLGPLVDTQMTRCISCTRCVRFTTEVAGITQMGQTGRGEDAEITAYLNETLESELQGNIIDLCPVGALTSKPYAFTARPWELRKTETIDVMDALGSNIRVDTRGREVMRILPRNHDGVNEEWISDKTRFVWDGLRCQRLDRPYVRRNGVLQPATWPEALRAAAGRMSSGKFAALAGDLPPVEAIYALKKIASALGGTVECRTDGARLPRDNRSGYVGTAAVSDIDGAEEIMLVGSNPRAESPVLNARLRKAWLAGAEIVLVGEPVDLTFDYAHRGTGRDALRGLLAEQVPFEPGTRKSLVIIGQGAISGEDGLAVLGHAMALAGRRQSGFLVLHTAAARVGGLDIGFATRGGLPEALDGAETVFSLGADDVDLPDGAFVIYQGSHGDRGAHRADVILPSAAYTEEPGLFVNTEGRPQTSARAGFPPGDARENWAVLRALSAHLGDPLPYESLPELRRAMFVECPHLAAVDQVPGNEWRPVAAGDMGDGDFVNAVEDFYLTNPIARASATMAELSRNAAARRRIREKAA